MCFSIQASAAALFLGTHAYGWSLSAAWIVPGAGGNVSWRYILVVSFVFFAMLVQAVDVLAYTVFEYQGAYPKVGGGPVVLRGRWGGIAGFLGFLLISLQSTMLLTIAAFFQSLWLIRAPLLIWAYAVDLPQLLYWLFARPNRDKWMAYEFRYSPHGLLGTAHIEIYHMFFVHVPGDAQEGFLSWYAGGTKDGGTLLVGRSFMYLAGTTVATVFLLLGVADEPEASLRLAMYICISVLWGSGALSLLLTYAKPSGRTSSVWCWTTFAAAGAAVVPALVGNATLLASYLGTGAAVGVAGALFGWVLRELGRRANCGPDAGVVVSGLIAEFDAPNLGSLKV